MRNKKEKTQLKKNPLDKLSLSLSIKEKESWNVVRNMRLYNRCTIDSFEREVSIVRL